MVDPWIRRNLEWGLRRSPARVEPPLSLHSSVSSMLSAIAVSAVAFTVVRPFPLRQSIIPALSVPPPEYLRSSRLVLCEGADLETKLASMQRENQGRGAVVLGLVLLAIVWSFSVPPDIRRSVICSSQAERDAGLGCVEASAVAQRVADHYQTCGTTGVPCIQWDFSIDPGKKAATSFVLDQLRSLDASDLLPTPQVAILPGE